MFKRIGKFLFEATVDAAQAWTVHPGPRAVLRSDAAILRKSFQAGVGKKV